MKQISKKSKIDYNSLSLSGKFFCRFDILCHNFREWLRKHCNTIDLFFLTLIVILEIILAILVFIYTDSIEKIKIIVSVSIIIFLYIIGVERIILNFKSRQAQEDKDQLEREYFSLQTENNSLRQKNKELIDRSRRLFTRIYEEKFRKVLKNH